jgi:FkbM family methyltransferase
VGANVGRSTYSIATVLPKGRIISFEPNPTLHDTLRRVLTRDGHRPTPSTVFDAARLTMREERAGHPGPR